MTIFIIAAILIAIACCRVSAEVSRREDYDHIQGLRQKEKDQLPDGG